MIFIALCAQGLEGTACRELKERVADAAILDQGRGAVLFSAAEAETPALLSLHSIDDLFAQVVVVDDLDPRRSPLAALIKAIRAAPEIEPAMALRRRGRGSHVTFRVMSQVEGQQPYRRVDAQRAAEDALGHRFGWTLIAEGAPHLQFALWITDGAARLGLRLTEPGFTRRRWKVGHIPASLPPSVAYGLLRAAGPRGGETLLDPFCGAGTILVERGLIAPPPGALLGADTSLTAREAAAANAAEAGVAVQLHDWDATALPLEAATVDCIVTNPPYGQRYGRPADLPPLYAGFLAEAARVLRPGGRCVVLTSERLLMERLLATRPELARRKRFPIDLLGLSTYVHVLDRVPASA